MRGDQQEETSDSESQDSETDDSEASDEVLLWRGVELDGVQRGVSR